MCYYTEIPSSDKIKLKEYKAKLSEKFVNNKPNVMLSGFDHPKLPVIMNDNPDIITGIDWGLVPTGAKIEDLKKIRKQNLNAISDELHLKKSYKNNIQNRCLVIVSGFYEWKHLHDKAKTKQRHRISMKDEEVFALGGIFSFWKLPNKDAYYRSFTILTTHANPLMAEIHNTAKRMPVIIEPHNYADYLNPKIPIENFISPIEDSLMFAEMVG